MRVIKEYFRWLVSQLLAHKYALANCSIRSALLYEQPRFPTANGAITLCGPIWFFSNGHIAIVRVAEHVIYQGLPSMLWPEPESLI